MENGQVPSSFTGCKPCRALHPSLHSCPVKRPTYTTFCFKNFLHQVDFQSKQKLPCKNTWYRDLKATHIRNRNLLDLSAESPKCCAEIYNTVLDRLKLKKIQKYGLTRPVRELTPYLETEERIICEAEKDDRELRPCSPEGERGEEKPRSSGEEPKEGKAGRPEHSPECYQPSDSESESEEEAEFKSCSSGSLSECSGCSTLEGRTRRKKHKVVKKDWRDLLHVPGAQLCSEIVAEEIRKHKLGFDLTLKLKNIF